MYVCMCACKDGWIDEEMSVYMNVCILVYVCAYMRIIMKSMHTYVYISINLHKIVFMILEFLRGWMVELRLQRLTWLWEIASVYSNSSLQVKGVGGTVQTYRWSESVCPR